MRNIERLVPGVTCASAILVLLCAWGQFGTGANASDEAPAPVVKQATGGERAAPKVDISVAKPQAEKPEGGDGQAQPAPAATRPPGTLTKEDVKSFEPVEGEVIDPLVMVVEPAILDLGEIPTGDTGVGKITLTNGGEVDRIIRDCKTSCGCTTANCKKGQTLKPGESMEVEIKLDGGQTERALNKTVTFMVSGQPQIRVPVKAQSIAFVTIEPAVIDPEKHLDGKLTLASRDGQPFRITSMHPQVIATFDETPKSTHEVVIDWKTWEAQEQRQRKMLFNLDHPKCSKVYATVAMKPVVPQAREEREKHAQPNAGAFATMVKSGQIDQAIEAVAAGKVPADGTDNNGRTTLSIAAESGDVRLIQAVLDASADIEATDRRGATPLMYAVQSKKVAAVQALLDSGADVNASDQVGSTALSWASSPLGHSDMVSVLIAAGADIESTAPELGFTPLIWAAGFGESPESAKILIDAKANLEARSFEQATPLMYAVRTNKPENVKLLLDHGANLEAKDAEGKTALLMACSNAGPDAEMIKLLIERGADVTVRSASGLGALDLAMKRTDPRSEEVINFLKTIDGVPAIAVMKPAVERGMEAAKHEHEESDAGGNESATPQPE